MNSTIFTSVSLPGREPIFDCESTWSRDSCDDAPRADSSVVGPPACAAPLRDELRRLETDHPAEAIDKLKAQIADFKRTLDSVEFPVASHGKAWQKEKFADLKAWGQGSIIDIVTAQLLRHDLLIEEKHGETGSYWGRTPSGKMNNTLHEHFHYSFRAKLVFENGSQCQDEDGHALETRNAYDSMMRFTTTSLPVY